MKKQNVNFFIWGFLFSSAVFVAFGFNMNKQNSREQSGYFSIHSAVTPAQAAQYRANYVANFPQGLQAVNISRQQLEVLNQTATQLGDGMRNVSGFRLYFGSLSADPNSQIVSIAYSINNSLQQNPPGQTVQMAEGFPRSYAQQCPPFCD